MQLEIIFNRPNNYFSQKEIDKALVLIRSINLKELNEDD